MLENNISKIKFYISVILILCAMIWLGFYIRTIPITNLHNLDLQWDAAYNYRMCQELVSKGHLPRIDKLAVYPIGRKIHEETSIFLYYATAGFHWISTLIFGVKDLQRNIFYFNSLCGAFIAIPVFLVVLSITKIRFLALISAFIATILPLSVQRTFCSYFRYEVMGIFFIMLFFAFFIRALNAENSRRSAFEIIISAILLFVALGSWRVTLLFFPILSIVFLFFLLFYENIARPFFCYWVLVIGYLISCLSLPYLRVLHYILSPEGVFVYLIVVFTIVLYYITQVKKISISSKLKKILAAIVIVGLAGFFLTSKSKDINELIHPIIKLSIAQRTNQNTILTSNDLLMGNSPELQPMKLRNILGIDGFSWCSFLIIIYFFITCRYLRSEMQEKMRFLIFLLLLIFMVLTLAFASRMLTVLSPISAIAIGVGLESFYKKYILKSKQESCKDDARVFGSLLVIILLLTTLSSSTIMMSYKKDSRMSPIFNRLLSLFKNNTPPGSVIWAHWQYGYPIMTYANCITIVDGGFNPTIRSRVIEGSKILVSEDEEDLINFCRKYNISYILQTRTLFPSPMQYLGLNFNDYYTNGHFTDKAKKTLLLRMFNEPSSFKYIKSLFQEGEYSVYYVPEIFEKADKPK